MAEDKHRVILDTNLWISFLLTKSLSKIDRLFQEERFVLLFSQELLDEFLEVAERPKFRKYFPIAELQNLLHRIKDKAEFVEVTSSIELCRDPKDNFLLSLAKDGKATHLITGDKDLLVLEKIGGTRIIPIASYFEA
jgi:hypothetical protein